MSDGDEVSCAGGYAQISGENWEGPPADGSEAEGWHKQSLVVLSFFQTSSLRLF